MNQYHGAHGLLTKRSALGLWALACCAGAGPPQYRANVLPSLAGHPSVYPFAINEDGVIAALAATDRFDPAGTPVRTSIGFIAPLFVPSESSLNIPQAISTAATVVGVSNATAFYWSGGSGMTLASPPGYGPGFGYGLNDAGQIVGSQVNDLLGIELPAYWDDASAEGVLLAGLTEPVQGAAQDINNSGVAVGWIDTDSGGRAARWDDPTNASSQPTLVGMLTGAAGSEALDINNLGDIAGRSVFPDSRSEAMLYVASSGEVIGLGDLGAGYSFAYGLNDERTVVGESRGPGGVSGFVWADGALRDLNERVVTTDLPYSAIVGAFGINDNGQIAAEVTLNDSPFSEHRAAVLTPLTPGDLNGDGNVDITDLALLLSDYACFGACAGDVNGDGATDISDLATLLANYGK